MRCDGIQGKEMMGLRQKLAYMRHHREHKFNNLPLKAP
jgi:hypothetical protein